MDELIIAGRSFTSRLMVGTGKFASNAAMVAAMEGAGSEIVTVALRRVDIDNPQDSLLRHIDPARYLLPDPIETLKAAEVLVKEGFIVLPYINADPVLAKHLQEAGTATVMPLGAPIGTNKGLRTRDNIAIIIEQAVVPVVVDAGLGAPSHAAEAMEMGADAVLVNTALAVAREPGAMGAAFKKGVEAGREAYLAGLGKQQDRAEASSPLTGFLHD